MGVYRWNRGVVRSTRKGFLPRPILKGIPDWREEVPAHTRGEPTVNGLRDRVASPPLLLTLVLMLALAIRLPHLAGRSFTLDEITSVVVAGADWSTFWLVVTRFEANMSLYYVALRAWMLLGDSEPLVRFLSVIFGVATIPIVHALGTRWFGVRAGLVAALLLALNGLHASWSQAARGYTLAVLIVTLSAYYSQRETEEPRARHWVVYVVTSVLAVYAHFFAGLVLLSQWVSLGLLRRQAVPWRRAAISIAAIIVGVTPLLMFTVIQDVDQIDWQEEPSLQRVLGAFNFLAGGNGSRAPLVLYVATLTAAVLAMVRPWRTAWGSPAAWRHGFLVLWLALPIGLALGISIVKPVFSVRYLTLCIPPLVVLAAVGVDRIRSRAFLAAALVIFGVAAVPSVRTPPDLRTTEWERAVTYVLRRTAPADGLFFYVPKGRLAFDHYRRRITPQAAEPVVVFPSRWQWEYLVTESILTPPPEMLRGLSNRHDRVWLVLAHDWVRVTGRDRVSRSIQSDLATQFPVTESRPFRGVRVVLYKKHAQE
jgi:uncharacterized membrane protein